MKKGDVVFYYHSVTGKSVVGIAKVAKEHYPDATAEEGDWSCVDLVPVKPMKRAVSLEKIKGDKILKEMLLVRHSRLSVTPVTKEQADRLFEIGNTRP